MSSKPNNLLLKLLVRIARGKQRAMLHLTRIKFATCYVKSVRTVRMMFLAYLGVTLFCLLLGCGFILLHVGLFYHLTWSVPAKGLLLLALGGVYLLIAITALAFLTSERLWMRASRADKAVQRAVSDKPIANPDAE